jgi:hypothetical protein
MMNKFKLHNLSVQARHNLHLFKIVMHMSDYGWGLDWYLDLNERLYTKLITAINRSDTADSHSAIHCSTQLGLLRLLYLHQSLPGGRSQQCPLLPCSFSYWLVTVSQQPPTLLTPFQSQSYVTTDGQSASLSWCQAPIWGL